MRELAHTRQHSWSSKSGKHYCFLAELRLGNPVAPGRKGECRREPHTGPHRALWVPRIAVQLRGDWSLLVPPESSRCPWRRRRRLQACTRAAITTASGTRIQSWRAPACRSSRQIGADQLCLQRSRSGQRLRADRQRQVVHARGHQPDSQHDRPAAAGHEGQRSKQGAARRADDELGSDEPSPPGAAGGSVQVQSGKASYVQQHGLR